MKNFLLAASFYTATALLFFSPVLVAGRILAPGDAVHNLASFNQNHIWTDLFLCGFALLADPQAFTLYPLRILCQPFGQALGWNLFLILPCILSGLFTYGYAYSLTANRPAAILAGLIFAFNGFHISNIRHVALFEALAWLPLLLWSVRELQKKYSVLWFFLAVLSTILFCLSGQPQMFVYGVVLVGSYVLLESSLAPPTERLSKILIAGAALVCGFAACAVQLLPLLELSQLSWRWTMSYKSFSEWSLFPFQLLNFVFPYLFGGFRDTIYGVNYFGAYNMQTTSDYCGLIPFTFVPLAFFARRSDRITSFWLFWLVFAFLMALGDAGVVDRLMYLIPIYNKFRAPSRHVMEFTMAVSALTAIGANAFSNTNSNTNNDAGAAMARNIQKGALFFFAVAALLAVAFANALQKRVMETNAGNFGIYPWNNLALALPIVLILIWFFVFKVSLAKPKIRWICLILFTVFDLGTFAIGAEYIADPKPVSIYTPPPHAITLRADLEKTRQRLLSLRGNSGTMDELPVNLSMLWNVPNATMYQSLMPARLSQLLNVPEGGFVLGAWADPINIPETGFLLGDWSKPENTALDTLAVKYVLLPKADKRYPAPQGDRWHFVQEAGQALVYENKRACPRAWLVTKAVYMSPEKMLYTLQGTKGDTIDPRQTVLLEGTKNPTSFPDDPAKFAKLLDLSETEMVVQTHSKADAYLLTADTFYPGWEVEIDGKSATLLPANYVIRAVLVPQGEHKVRFIYRSNTIRNGAIITCVALFLSLVIGCALAYRQRKTESN